MFTDKYVYESLYDMYKTYQFDDKDVYLVRDINSPIPQFTNPRFFYRHIHTFIGFFFCIEIIQPFINLEGAIKCISQHH